MAFADPQNITLDGAKALVRVYHAQGVGTFEGPNDELTLEIRPTVTAAGRHRKVVNLKQTKSAEMGGGLSDLVSASITLVIDTPPAGFVEDDVAALATAFTSWLNAAGNLKKVVGGEN